ncbi:hypothetical protein ACEPAI_1846 [Sanghuangporus weigelae]
MSGKPDGKAVKQDEAVPASAKLSNEVLAVRPTREDLVYVLFLLINLSLSSHALQANVKPLFEKTYGELSFHGGALLSFIIFSFALQDRTSVHRKTLEVMSVLQVAASVGARSLGAFVIPYFAEKPTAVAWIVHAVSSFPILGLGGAVWLHWTSKFMDEEPTGMGRLIIKVFSCVALISVVKYIEPFVGNTLLQFADIPPKATLIFLAMTAYILGVTFKPSRSRAPPSSLSSASSAPSSNSDSEVQSLSRSIAMLSVFMAMLAVYIPPQIPSSLTVQYQRFTPHGFIQIVDNRLSTPATRYVRVDSSILGEVELKADGSVGDARAVSAALLEGVKLVYGQKGRRALVIGVQSGASAKSLLASSYNTTIVDTNAALISTVQSYFNLPMPDSVIPHDPTIWVPRYARHVTGNAGNRKDEKFDVVVHDVFDGGELPARMYTMEFWSAIGGVLNEKGVLAVRYVGRPTAVTLKSTLNMLRKNFRTCRAFHSSPSDKPLSSTPDEIAEIVIYCTPSDTLLFTFSSSQSSKLSASASTILSSLDTREVDINAVLGGISPDKYLLKEEDPAVIRMWGKDGIVDYWRLMREKYPESVWYSY